MRCAPAAALAGAVCLLTSAAQAQVTLSTEVSPRKVEVGDRFMVRLRAMSDGDERASDPQLKLPAGITGSGPSVGSQTQMSIVNGRMSQTVGINATWVLTASQPGTYRIGPASVQTSLGRKQDRVVTVEVVPAGTLQQDPPPLSGQPFDPWGMLRGFGNSPFPGMPGFPNLDEPEPEPQLPQLPDEYRIDQPLDPLAFLRARAVPKKVVVGEQVTLSVYAYAGRGNFEPGLGSEPSRDDFLAFNLQEPTRQLQGYQFDLGGQRWITVKLSEFALFPLKAGKLKAGLMSFAFVGRNYSKDPRGLKRESQPIEITVVEPPLDGRPPGYRVGDVGRYSLSAQVEPREVPAGGSISVVAKLEGTGHVPQALLLPEQKGVRFLEPQVVEQVAPRNDVVQGFRTFTYVVELTQPGELDLGDITLPYWDPKSRSYGVARAALGKVKVTGTAPALPSAAKTEPGRRLSGLVTPPAKLGPYDAGGGPLTSQRGYWLVLLGLPLATLLGFVLSDLVKLLSRRMSERRGSLAAALDDALRALTAGQTSPAHAAGAAERALFLAIEKGTGLRARGLLKAELEGALTRAGLPEPLAGQTAALLGRCDELRFAGEAVELPVFVADVRKVCQALATHKARKAEPSQP